MPALKQTFLAPTSYPPRASVGEDVYDWEDPNYHPVDFTEKFILAYPKPTWADHPNVALPEILNRKTINRKGETVQLWSTKCFDFNTGRFLNPRGKTGITGRGELGCWGPPIYLRWWIPIM